MPVKIRFTLDAAECDRLQAAYAKVTLRQSVWLPYALAVWLIIQGLLNVTTPYGIHIFGYAQLLLGVCLAIVQRFVKRALQLVATSTAPCELTIDDVGITIESPPKRILWNQIVTIRDVGEAFVAAPRFGSGIAIVKRALPDGGSALWAALDAKLTASRYLVRGTDARSTIYNTVKNGRE